MTATSGPGADEHAQPEAGHPELSLRQINLIFATVMLGMLLSALDQTIVSTALPTIVADVGGAGHLSWVVSSYLLADTVATVLAGKFGDVFGRKLVFQVSTLLFVGASAACGFAGDMVWLIGWRAVQGIGAGGLAVTATALIGDVIPLRSRGRYQGALGAVFGVTTVLGPLVGGLFTDHLSWRWAFFINMPLGILVVIVASATLPRVAAATVRPTIDYLGIVFVTIGTATLTLGLSWGGTEYAWGSVTIIGLFVVAVVALCIFVYVEHRAAEPILPLRLFRGQVFSVSVILAFIVGFAMLGAMTFLPTYLQYVRGISATGSGVRTLPMVLGLLVTSIVAGSAVGRTGRYRIYPIIGTLLMALGLYLLSRMDEHTGFWEMAGYMVVLGAGIGLSMQILTIVVQNTSSFQDLGVATSGVTFFRTLGSSFGAAIFGTIYANVLASKLPGAIAAAHGFDPAAVSSPKALHAQPPDVIAPIVRAYAQTVHEVFLYAVPVALVAFVLALCLKEVPLRGTAQAGASAVGEGFGMPGTDSTRQLQLAIARLGQREGLRERIIARAGSSLDSANAWCAMQVQFRVRLDADTSLGAIARRYRVPQAVLAPAFEQAVARGFLTGDPTAYGVTEQGRTELGILAEEVRGWLAHELSDWSPDDEQLRTALAAVARRMVEDDPDMLPEVPAKA